MSQKIFCIGFQKTGTSSLARALSLLGYSVGDGVKELNAGMDWQAPDLEARLAGFMVDFARNFDVLQDSPCAFMYRAFDQAYPDSKFILTKRAPEAWLESYRRYFPDGNNPLRRWMYGVDRLAGNEAHYLALYQRQNAEIIEYFKDRPEDLLVMDLSNGDGWQELVGFLGKDFLKPFPHVNKGKS